MGHTSDFPRGLGDCTSDAGEVVTLYDFGESDVATAFVTVWQPVPLCSDFDGSTNEIIRVNQIVDEGMQTLYQEFHASAEHELLSFVGGAWRLILRHGVTFRPKLFYSTIQGKSGRIC